MKNTDLVVTRQNNIDTIKYTLGVADVFDDRTADKLSQLNNVIPIQYSDEDGKRIITAYAHEDATLETFMKKTLSKREVLCIMSGLTSVFELGAQGIPVSYIVKDAGYIYINAETLAVKAVLIPLKQDVMPLAEMPVLFREVISNMKFDETDIDNYVAQILTVINSDDFSVGKLKSLVDKMLEEMGLFISKDNGLVGMNAGGGQPQNKDIKVNKLGVMNNMRPQQVPMGQPQMNQMPGQPPMGQPQMNQMPGQPPMGQPQMNQMPGQPPMGQPQMNQMPGRPQMGQPQMNQMPGRPPMGQPQMNQMPGRPSMGQPQMNQMPGRPPMGQPQMNQMPGRPPMGQPQMNQMPGRPPMGQPQMNQMPGRPPMGQPQMNQMPGRPPMGQPQMNQMPGQAPMGQPQMNQMPGRPPMGQPQMNQMPGQAPVGQPQQVAPAPQPVAPAPQPVAPAPAPMPTAPKVEMPKPEMPKPEMPKPEAPKPEMPKAPVPQPVAPTPQPVAPAPKPVDKVEDDGVVTMGNLVGQLGTKPVPHLVRKKTGETINITKPEFAIGKSHTKTDYAIENNTAISRVHCIIVQRNGVNYIKDNNSTNHTYIDGVELKPGQEVLLKNKMTIQLGDEEFTFLLRKGE